MKRFGMASTLGGAVLLAAVPGCSIGGADDTPSPQSTPAPTRAAVGGVDGTFRVGGGPYPGIDEPLSGTITFTGPVTERVSASDGTFTVGLPPGEYKVSGQPEGHFAAVICASTTVTVAAAKTERVDVACAVE